MLHERDSASDIDAAAGVPEATFVPRQPGVKDGPWSKIDDKLVVAAQKDATKAVGRSVLDAAGEVQGGGHGALGSCIDFQNLGKLGSMPTSFR